MYLLLYIFVCSIVMYSDATDPFTRDPLTMDQVVPNVELKEQIEAWRNNLPSNN